MKSQVHTLCDITGTYTLDDIMGTCCLSAQIHRIGMALSELEGALQTWTDRDLSVEVPE